MQEYEAPQIVEETENLPAQVAAWAKISSFVEPKK
jgi:hypothetical protein